MRLVIYDDFENVIYAHYIEETTLHDEEFLAGLAGEVDDYYQEHERDALRKFEDTY